MINDTQRLPEGGAWLGTVYVLPCRDESAHFAQEAALFEAEEAGKDCDISYTNALYCGVYPCFISEAADIDDTCIAIAWPDESFELMQQAGGLINRALLAYHRGLTDAQTVAYLSIWLKEHICGSSVYIERKLYMLTPFIPILNWEPAPGGAAALAELKPLFPPAPLGMTKG